MGTKLELIADAEKYMDETVEIIKAAGERLEERISLLQYVQALESRKVLSTQRMKDGNSKPKYARAAATFIEAGLHNTHRMERWEHQSETERKRVFSYMTQRDPFLKGLVGSHVQKVREAIEWQLETKKLRGSLHETLANDHDHRLCGQHVSGKAWRGMQDTWGWGVDAPEKAVEKYSKENGLHSETVPKKAMDSRRLP